MIEKIRIRDFKSIRDVTLELGDVTVLVGKSGTGKSNLVQAIRFLRNSLLGADAAAVEGSWDSIIPAGQDRASTSFDLSFRLPGEEDPYAYRIAFDVQRGAPLLTSEELLVGNTPVFGWKGDRRAQRGWTYKPDIAQPPNVDGHFLLGRLPVMQRAVFAYAALSSGIGYYHFPSNVLGLREPQNRETVQLPGLLDNGSNYLVVLKQIIQDFRNPEIRRGMLSSLRAVNSSIVSAELDNVTSPQRVIVGHGEKRTISLSLSQESDGLRRFYIHLIALYQTPPKLTMVFEEPENAIFPGALSLLAEEFNAAPREGRGQVIITTHSPGLLDSFDVAAIRVVDMVDGQTRVGPVATDQAEAVRDRLMKTGELLTVVRPRIEGLEQGLREGHPG